MQKGRYKGFLGDLGGEAGSISSWRYASRVPNIAPFPEVDSDAGTDRIMYVKRRGHPCFINIPSDQMGAVAK